MREPLAGKTARLPGERGGEGRSSTHLLLVVEYDGSGFFGWQRQREGPTVQECLEDAFRKLGARAVSLLASGRTDRGVHSRGLLARAKVSGLKVPPERLPRALCAHLPPGIAVPEVYPVPEGFHPIRDTRRKRYRYTILERRAPSPLLRGKVWHLKGPLDLQAMRRAARFIRGRHDFAAFASEAGSREDTVRTIHSVRISREGDLVHIEVEGDGFLYNMVRAIAGSLAEVGRGRFPPGWMRMVLEGRDRRKAGPTAPAEGLALVEAVPDLAKVRPGKGDW